MGVARRKMFKPVRLSEFTSAIVAQKQHKLALQSLPPVYRLQCGDLQRFLVSLCGGLTQLSGPNAVGKETGKTSYIERFNCTLAQRVSRLVRKTLSFSKKLENHKASNQVIHSLLQCLASCLLILSCLGLPKGVGAKCNPKQPKSNFSEHKLWLITSCTITGNVRNAHPTFRVIIDLFMSEVAKFLHKLPIDPIFPVPQQRRFPHERSARGDRPFIPSTN